MNRLGKRVVVLAAGFVLSAPADEWDWSNTSGDNDVSNTANVEWRTSSGYNFLNVSLNEDGRGGMRAVSIQGVLLGMTTVNEAQ